MVQKQIPAEQLLKYFSMKMFVHLKVPVAVNLAIYHLYHTLAI